jgi:hypothetical protein
MLKQNVTLSLPKTLLKRAKKLAFQEEKSFNEFVKQCLEHRLSKATNFTRARDRQLRLMETGIHLGTNGRISVARDELHERR